MGKVNARSANLNHVRFVGGNVEDMLPVLVRDLGIRMNTVILDPARRGSDAQVLAELGDMNPKPERLVYISCNPPALARDTERLNKLGFDFIRAIPVDMFPHTKHVEVVALFQPSGHASGSMT